MAVDRVAVRSMGLGLPTRVIDNDTLVRRFGLTVDDAWIRSRTGVASRHWVSEGETTSDRACRAVIAALETSGRSASDVERLLLATITPDRPSPSTATRVLHKAGLRCMATDLSAACAGFLYALELGSALVRTGDRAVMIAAADVRSRFVNPTDRRSVVLFSDAAAAALLVPGDDPEAVADVISVWCGAEGREDVGAWVPAGGAELPASEETVRQGLHYVHLEPRNTVFEHFLRFASEAVERALSAAGLSLSDIDWLVPHQGNSFLVMETAKLLGFPLDRTLDRVANHGNSAGAALPVALVEAFADGTIRPGQTVLLVTAGAGHAFGSAVLRRRGVVGRP